MPGDNRETGENPVRSGHCNGELKRNMPLPRGEKARHAKTRSQETCLSGTISIFLRE